MLMDGDRISAPQSAAQPLEGKRRWGLYALGFIVTFVVLGSLATYLIFPKPISKTFPGFRSFKIPSASMAPTLREKHHVLVNFFTYRFQEPRRGDLVLLESSAAGTPLLSIKRIVAIGGDVVSASNGEVTLNGHGLQEPYLNRTEEGSTAFGAMTVPANEYFVLGDNRYDSYDSRYFGPVTRANIKGHVAMVMHADDPTHQWRDVR
jgi:signal peptidase I